MNEVADPPFVARDLPRTLGLRDLVLLNAVAIVSVQWLTTAAQFGAASIGLWILVLVLYFLPSGLAVIELSSRYPDEGGIYRWVRHAFGDAHGFLVGWCYSITNFVYLPFLLLFVAAIAVHVGGNRWLYLNDSPVFLATFCLVLLWTITAANIVGLQRAKWIANAGAICLGLALLALGVAACASVASIGSATELTLRTMMPSLSDPSALPFLATMTLAFGGFEVGPVLGGEIHRPARTIPRAMLISGALIALIYIGGTALLLVTLPGGNIGVVTGIPEAAAALGDRLGVPFFAPVVAGLLTIGTIGLVAAWITAVARVPFVIGEDGHLPHALSRLHPRWGTPHIALLVQAAVCTVLLLTIMIGASVREAYEELLGMNVFLIFLPYAYMFVALPVLRRRPDDGCKVLLVPGGPIGLWAVTLLGAGLSLMSMTLALMPPANVEHTGVFVAKVLGISGALLLSGWPVYFAQHKARRTFK